MRCRHITVSSPDRKGRRQFLKPIFLIFNRFANSIVLVSFLLVTSISIQNESEFIESESDSKVGIALNTLVKKPIHVSHIHP